MTKAIAKVSKKKVRAFNESANVIDEEFDCLCLPMGKYDVDFVITMCKRIEQVCEEQKFNPYQLCMTLQHSLRKLRTSLEQDKLGSYAKVMKFCPKCKNDYFVWKDHADKWKCHCDIE